MRSISQRELRNDTAAIMRAVEAGESFTVTRRGVPVARVVPVPESDLRQVKAAAPDHDVTDLPRGGRRGSRPSTSTSCAASGESVLPRHLRMSDAARSLGIDVLAPA